MLNLKEYIDGIKPLLNVPADYTPNCYYGGGNDMRVRFQIQMAQLPKSFDFARTVINPDSFLFDCSFTLTEQETDPSHVYCQVRYWVLSEYLVDSQNHFRDLMDRMHDNKFLPDNQKKFLDRNMFTQQKSEFFPLTEIVTKFKKYLEILRKQYYGILNIVDSTIYKQYYKEIKALENKMEEIMRQKLELMDKISKQIQKDIKIYKEFEM